MAILLQHLKWHEQILHRNVLNKKLTASFLFTAGIKDFRDGYHGWNGN